ncbi:ribose-phosphate diphosphokinase [Chondromyces apiculatus]|uniref:ribose-phosphate diphosphokinase n=1 Tax=Chondromyces apiculatus DSM 436 TaxID=1192034 RepID=A0A017SUA9_9BACT|nr:ribose-phosphate diphosphokinase [Chondromyces apiculatus]EYF00200.1 Ribose-phosphate pyrophosphokinase [Chondromyces apiculatus DSM 436]
MKRLLFAIQSYAYLVPAFLKAAELELGEVEHKVFPDGERYLRVATDCWGKDVLLLGGTPNDLDWLELYDLGYAISRAGARSLSIIMPYFGYATMERAVKPGEVVTAKTRAHLVSAIPPCEGGTRVFLFDLHTDGIAYYFDDSHVTRHVYGAPLVCEAVRALMGDRPYVLAATDAGRAKWVQSLARDLGVEPAFVYKERREGKLGVTGVNADVAGREVVIYDDMIRTGGSLVQAARAYHAAGASKVHAVTSHLVLPGDSLEKIKASGEITTLMGTDSHPGSQQLAETPGAVWSVAALLTRALEPA